MGRFERLTPVYYETYETEEEARVREKEIKSKGREYREGLVRGMKEGVKAYKPKK